MLARRTVAKVLQFPTTLQKRPGVAAARGSPRRVRSRVMLGGRRSRAARFGGLTAVLALTAASAALAAPGTPQGGGASVVDATTQQLDTRAHQALLSLYALDSRLQAWRARLASLHSAANVLRQQRVTLGDELRADRASLKAGQRRLAVELRVLYEGGSVDPVAVVLGAKSLSTGLSRLDDLSRVADQSRQIAACADRNAGSPRKGAGSSVHSPPPAKPRNGSRPRWHRVPRTSPPCRRRRDCVRRRYGVSRPRHRPPSNVRSSCSRRRPRRRASDSSP